jgi:hypothetical protein
MMAKEETESELDVQGQALSKKVELGPSGEAIQRLERSKMEPSLKVDVLLVELGVKPATILNFSSGVWRPGEPAEQIDEAKFNMHLEAVRDAGLHIEVGADRLVNPAEDVTRGTDGQVMMMNSDRNWPALIQEGLQQVKRKLCIARSAEDLALVKLANETNDARLYGQAYGFPGTAVETYLRGEAISPDEVVGMPADVRPFAQYGFSASDSSAAEIAVAQTWHDAVLAASPSIYQEFVDSRN